MSFKHFELLEEVTYDELPQNVQTKLDNFEKLVEEYDELDEDDEENESRISDLELKMEAMDNGLYADIESYISERAKAQSQENQNEGQNDGNSNEGNSQKSEEVTHSEKPSWRFW